MDYDQVDIRLAVGDPTGKGDQPLKMVCPMHKARIGVEDDTGSLAVYRANVHCFGCGFHITRRYASLAFLLGEWDGVGDESSMRVNSAVRRIRARLSEFKGSGQPGGVRAAFVPQPVNPVDVEAFHQYLLTYARDPLAWLQRKRGLSLESIRRFRLGYTGTHFSIPVCGLDGAFKSIRYRADESVCDTNEKDFRKYDGTWGHNQPALYPLQVVRGVQRVESLWIVEGEYDALASNQTGATTLTVTNGATNVVKIADMVRDQLPGLHVNRWVIATDQDAAGEMAAEKLLSALPGPAVRARWGWGKDLTEFYATGGSRSQVRYEA